LRATEQAGPTTSSIGKEDHFAKQSLLSSDKIPKVKLVFTDDDQPMDSLQKPVAASILDADYPP
jgi:hypothetical protein